MANSSDKCGKRHGGLLMDALRIGGIVSGLDTNGIVDMLTSQAKQPFYRLERQYATKNLEKAVYQSFVSDLVTVKTDLLTLKLESTFKSKSVAVSNTSVLTATASLNAQNGSHTVTVNQTASSAYSFSHFTLASVLEKGAGVTGITGRPDDFLEGLHEVAVSTTTISSINYYYAKDTFTPNNSGGMTKYLGTALGIVDTEGELTSPLSGTFTISIDSTLYSVSVSENIGDDINKVAKDIEDNLNSQLNIAKNTDNKQYLSLRSDFDIVTGVWNFSIYDMSVEGFAIQTQSDSISQSLGLHNGVTSTVTQSSVSEITKYNVSDSYTNLLVELNDASAGLIPGSTFTVSPSLSAGEFKVAQDATLNVSSATNSKFTGVTVSSGLGLNTSITGLNNAGFLKSPSSSTNGTFTINGVKITIDDYTAISVNDLLAKINSSGAGVTASYDSTNDRIIIKANQKGAIDLSLGNYTDTSDILSVLKITAADGATETTGKTDGNVDPTAKLSEAGFTNTITSGIFTINGVSIYVDTTEDSLNDVIYKVNNSGAGVTLSYDENIDKVYIKSNSTSKIKIGSPSDTSNFLESLNITDDTSVETESGYAGKLALLNVDGINYVRNTNTIDDIISGVTLNIKNSSTDSVTIDISTDSTKAVEAFASFVQHYNLMVEKLSPPELDNEDKKYLVALTEDEKAAKTSEEVNTYQEKWEKFNTYEIIRKSSELRTLKNDLRTNLFAQLTGITGKFSSISDIGLSIAGNGDLEVIKKGKLVADSTDYDEILKTLNQNTNFMNALKNNPDDVFNLFAQNDDNGIGWSRNYENIINNYSSAGGLIYLKIQPYGTLDRQMFNLAKQMDDQQLRIENYLDRLWKQFSSMENQISSLQEQGNYLAQISASQTKK